MPVIVDLVEWIAPSADPEAGPRSGSAVSVPERLRHPFRKRKENDE